MDGIRRLVIRLGMVFAIGLSMPLAAQGLARQPAASPSPTVTATRAAGAPVPLDAADLEAWLDGFMPYALERGRIPGAVVVVVRGNGPVLQKGYGFADIASRRPVSPETTLFRPASTAKLVTWTAVMQQVEQGRIDLDKDVNSYLDFRIPPYRGKPVTMRNLMTHTAGFEEDMRHVISTDPKALWSIRKFARDALPRRIFAPGTTVAYSNYGTVLAAYIVERVSGVSFYDYIERHIFAPLGMARSTFRQPLPDRLKPLMASGYPDSTKPAQPFEIILPAGAGSMSATGADMGRFMMAHLNQGAGLMKPETARRMHDFEAKRVGPLNTLALGFYEQSVNGRRVIAHGGDSLWFHGYMWLFPKEDIGLYISMNGAGVGGATSAIRGALFHKFADRYLPESSPPANRVDDATARQHARMMAGNYIASRGSFTNFFALLGLLSQATIIVGDDGKIAMPALDGMSASARDWVEIAPFVWRDTMTGERLAAELRDGKVARLSMDAISFAVVYDRAPLLLNGAVLLPATLVSLLVILLAALLWPVRALVRRHYGAASAEAGRMRLAHRLSGAFAWAALLATAGWIAVLAIAATDVALLGGSLDWLLILLRILTPIAALGVTGASGWLLWEGIRGSRGWVSKVGAALLLAAGLVLIWIVIAGHLYGFSLRY